MSRAGLHALALVVCLAGEPRLNALAQATARGAIEGDVSTEHGAVMLPGAVVELISPDGAQVQQRTDPNGRFRIQDLPLGRYRAHASLEGFNGMDASVVISPGTTTRMSFELRVVAAETVTVTGQAISGSTVDDPGAPAAIVGSREIDQFTPGGSFQDAIRLLATVLEVPGGLSIKGGRPDQSGVQLGLDTIVEPSTGLAPLIMPADAVDSVTVLPNPYAVEYGRFSSGLIVISTRRAEDVWRFRINDLDPDLRTKRSQNFSVLGVKAFTPRLEIGGPLIKDRVFLEQAVQYSYRANDVPSLPENELTINHWLSTFTRVDVNAGPKQSVVMTGGFFTNNALNATLGTFVPPDATIDSNRHIQHASAVARTVWSSAVQSETTFGVQSYAIRSDPHGEVPMVLRPDTTIGNFFNRQSRDTESYQFADTLTLTARSLGIMHMAKFGVDLLASRYRGSSISGPVLVERADGSLARRIDFEGPTSQNIRSLDAALFAEDRMQISDRWLVEYGGRVDRDGVLDRMNVAPRVGVSVALNRARTATLHGGAGLFSERTPLSAGVFQQFQSGIDTRLSADGVTPLSGPTAYENVVAPGRRTARSAVWSLNYDYRLNSTWSWHAALLDRRGAGELIVQPLEEGGVGQLRLSSTGRSRYRDVEAGVHFTRAPGWDIEATYTRSAAREDLNAFTTLFGPVLAPIVGPNAYAPSSADAPNRLFVRGRFSTKHWLVLGLADVHSGFPYSVVDADLDFVGPRNVGYRLPTMSRTEIGVERRVRIGGIAPWIGVRVDNPFNRFSPTDVQANLSSPDFGALYNSAYRKTRLIVRFER